jgi:hypothetical protein
MDIQKLRPLEKNPFRGKGDKQLKLIAESIEEFEKMMTIRKIVIDENFEILGGNKRYFALKMLGKTEIHDTWIDQRTDLTEAEKREFIVKDNSHFGSEWDLDLLKDWNVDCDKWGVKAGWLDDNKQEVDYSAKNQEIDPGSFEDEMIIKLKYTEAEYLQVREQLSKIAETPEQAVWKLLGNE